MRCLLTTHPLWQYEAVWLGFLLAGCAAVWAARDQWRETRPWRRLQRFWMRWCYRRDVTLLTSRVARSARWISWHAHKGLAIASGGFALLSAWVAGAVFVNSILYVVAVRAGVPHLGGCQ